MSKILGSFLLAVVLLLLAMLGFRMWTKSFSPIQNVQLTNNDLTVSVIYCQPSMKGRKIFGEVVPYGKVWRTGANEATRISFSRDVTIENKTLEAGEYSLWTIPGQKKWTIIFNSETGQWGTMYDSDKDILKVEAQPQQQTENTELLNIGLHPEEAGKITLTLEWEKVRIAVPIE
jgi:hypothetical protein